MEDLKIMMINYNHLQLRNLNKLMMNLLKLILKAVFIHQKMMKKVNQIGLLMCRI